MRSGTAWRCAEIVITIFLSLSFVAMGGVTKLTGAQFQRETFQHYEYPLWFMYVVGAVELALGLLILVRRFRFLAACGMVLITIGVVLSAARIGEFGVGILISPPVVVMMFAGFVAWLCQPGSEGE